MRARHARSSPGGHRPGRVLHEPVPAGAAGMFDPPTYRRFQRAVITALRALGRKFELSAEEGVVRIVPDLGDEGSVELGLENLGKVCVRSAGEEWPRLALWQFRTLLEAVRATPKPFQEVRSILKARLWPSGEVSEDSVHRDIGAGLCAVLVMDEPETIKTVPRTELESWPIGEEEAWALARDNLRGEGLTPETGRLPSDEGVQMSSLDDCEWYFASSHLLLMDELVPKGLPYGVLVAVPRRSSLLYHMIENGQDLSRACLVLALIAAGLYEEGPASITDRVFWWRDGVLSPIWMAPAVDPVRGLGISVELPDELLARLGIRKRDDEPVH